MGTLLIDCAFCDRTAVTMVNGTYVCKDHKNMEKLAEEFGKMMEPMLQGMMDKFARLEEEITIMRDLHR